MRVSAQMDVICWMANSYKFISAVSTPPLTTLGMPLHFRGQHYQQKCLANAGCKLTVGVLGNRVLTADSDKKEAQTFHLLYRPQNDPTLHDETAGERTL